MTKLQELKETVAKAQELILAIEREESILQVHRYDNKFYYMPLAILGMARRFLVMTEEEMLTNDGKMPNECVATLTYAEAMSGKTKEQVLAEFVQKRRTELGL